jgi:hypothetical protein
MIVGAIEEFNLLTQICEMFWVVTSIFRVIALSMHGRFFVLYVTLFLFCRFEANCQPSWLHNMTVFLVHMSACRQQQSHQDHPLGNDFPYFYWPVTY